MIQHGRFVNSQRCSNDLRLLCWIWTRSFTASDVTVARLTVGRSVRKLAQAGPLRQMVDYKVNHTSPGVQAVLPSKAGWPGGCLIHEASEPVRLRPCAVLYAVAHSVEHATARWTELVRWRPVEGGGIRF